MKRAGVFGLGLAAGVALVVACGQSGTGSGGVRSAEASPNDCATWQYAPIPGDLPTVPVPISGADGTQFSIDATELPSGWEPFELSTGAYMKRCKP